MGDSVSRAMWEAVERFHGLCYTAPEVRQEGAEAGLKGFWMNYFATRIAPLGEVGPDIVASTFFYYNRPRIDRAIPDAWRFSSRDAVLAARYRGMDQALRRVYGEAVDGPDMAEAAGLIAEAASTCNPIGRTLYAGWASLPWPEQPHLQLWHGCTLLREYRSGNHLIALAAEGLDGCESVVSHVAAGGAPHEWIHDEAGWSAADERNAIERLVARGWLDASETITAEGRAGRERIEALTDRLDLPVWEVLGSADSRRLFDLLSGFASALPPDDQLDWESIYS
ncbi:MAG: SCO6745 family protein [Acidimicrobiales bacterium]